MPKRKSDKSLPYGKWYLEDLKEELRERNARPSGRKPDLVKRLEDYDRNFNFGKEKQKKDVRLFKMKTPNNSTYKDITSSAVKHVKCLQRKTVENYLDINCQTVEDGERLYNERWVRFLRWSKTDGSTYYLGQSWAEMRRKTTYNVNVHISSAGEILEGECECPVGVGPSAHCKHVSAVFLALVDFTHNKQPNLEMTCTEQLQTFHKPKKTHLGSPVMAKDLKLYKTERKSVNFDPRPQKYRKMENYADTVKNLAVNFAANTGSQMPILQTIRPADMRAVEHDHLYGEPQSAWFLKKMNITEISPELADNIEEQTEKQSGSKEWKAERKKRMTASNFGRILGTVSDSAKRNLAEEMILGKFFKSKQTAHGSENEPIAIAKYENMSNSKVQKCGLVIAMDMPYLAGTPDGLVGDDIVLEVKCPYTSRYKMVTEKHIEYLVNDSNTVTLDKKHKYYAQIQGQMYVCEREMCHFVVHTFKDTKIFNIPRDESYIKAMLIKLGAFYNDVWRPWYLQKYFYNEC